MKKLLTVFISMLSFVLVTTSCTKENEKKTTQVTIIVKDGSGVAQSGVDVHMYTKTAFIVHGNDPLFTHKTATTGSDGSAVFNIVSPDDVLWNSSNTSEEFYYGILYRVGAVDKEKHTAVTLSEGDVKSANLVMN
ncbi:MAG: hypothetical protein IT275_04375 [Chitinophagales bacterium]|nr:hypothetical protein [Chitinophagales bacterium]